MSRSTYACKTPACGAVLGARRRSGRLRLDPAVEEFEADLSRGPGRFAVVCHNCRAVRVYVGGRVRRTRRPEPEAGVLPQAAAVRGEVEKVG